MSVMIMVRFKSKDLAKAKQTLAAKGDLLKEIAAVGKKSGAIHHQFLDNGKELIVLDEWNNAESFQKFFAGNEKIMGLAKEAGFAGEPKVEMLNLVETADKF